MARKKIASGWLLLGIVGLVVLAVLLAPSESDSGNGYSGVAASGGYRLAFDLAKRLGWSPVRRNVAFTDDSAPAPVQVLVRTPVGDQEAHALLEHVRHGGGLLVAGNAGSLSDSFSVTPGPRELEVRDVASDCPSEDPFAGVLRVPQPIAPVRWRQSPPPDTVGFGLLEGGRGHERAAVGFSFGLGRVVVVPSEPFLSNDVLRYCATEADVAYVRMLEYLTRGQRPRAIAFDEFHHGLGVHGGSLSAIRGYMIDTPSGRLLGQLVLAGLLLLLAAAPRPLAPRDPARIARRSPLEHADALAHAYGAVGATRTATARLLSGVRRRIRRGRAGSRETDDQFLAAATSVSPAASSAAVVVANALTNPVPARELVAVAGALSTIEGAFTSPSRPSTRKP
jgi:hypothetical protein